MKAKHIENPVRTALIKGVPKQIFSTKETAAYLGVSYSYLMKIRLENDDSANYPPHIFIGRKKWYVKEDLDKWLHQLPREYGQKPVVKMAKSPLAVELVNWTPNPDETVYRAAIICYSKEYLPQTETPDPEKMAKLIRHLYASGHLSTFEHASFTFAVTGVSRITTHQLVRHRMASFSQQSQRYVESGGHDVSVIPPSIAGNESLRQEYAALAESCLRFYGRLVDAGIKKEDARYILPHGMSSKITVTMNARELDHFFTLRTCNRAQWEIRELAQRMLAIAKEKAPLLFDNSGPACRRGECRENCKK